MWFTTLAYMNHIIYPCLSIFIHTYNQYRYDMVHIQKYTCYIIYSYIYAHNIIISLSHIYPPHRKAPALLWSVALASPSGGGYRGIGRGSSPARLSGKHGLPDLIAGDVNRDLLWIYIYMYVYMYSDSTGDDPYNIMIHWWLKVNGD